jgi:hypothetical protein
MSTQLPVEDISTIVSRFQAWAGAQAPSRANQGVRELTYEEALRKRGLRASSEASSPEAEQPAPVLLENAAPREPEKTTGLKKRASAMCSTVTSLSEDAPDLQAEALAIIPEQSAFRQVLAEKVSILPAAGSRELAVAERRTTALSLRVSSREHALLKMRAMEANLSVSCYLRNCVLEVESLRTQLAHKLEEQELAHVQPVDQKPVFAFCLRMVRKIFWGKTTALAVRA